jgi:Rieske Fe-S protein
MSPRPSALRGAIERLSGYVDDLLAERRPRRFRAQRADELRLLLAAARLRGARPGADQPDPVFLTDLRQQLATAAQDPDACGSSAQHAVAAPSVPRRRLLARLAGLVAAVAAGFGLGRLGWPDPPPTLPPAPSGPLVTVAGRWQRVAALADLPVGRVVRFSAGSLEGHLVHGPEGLYALSAVCTHQGCLLRWDRREREFECLCHGSAFELSGRMKYGPASYRDPLPPLPIIQSRVEDGQVYVWIV